MPRHSLQLLFAIVWIAVLAGFWTWLDCPSAQATPTIQTVAQAKAEAIRRYPDLARENSQMNRVYVARYKVLQKEQPNFFKANDWPLTLADEVAGTLHNPPVHKPEVNSPPWEMILVAVGFVAISCFRGWWKWYKRRQRHAADRGPRVDLHPSDPSPVQDLIFEEAFKDRRDKMFLTGTGVICKLLPDDSDGDRHQKFLVTLGSGQTLLISHNIDVARRVPGLIPGERILFRGEYIWNDQGGVIHWTHRDERSGRRNGWIEYRGKRYG